MVAALFSRRGIAVPRSRSSFSKPVVLLAAALRRTAVRPGAGRCCSSACPSGCSCSARASACGWTRLASTPRAPRHPWCLVEVGDLAVHARGLPRGARDGAADSRPYLRLSLIGAGLTTTGPELVRALVQNLPRARYRIGYIRPLACACGSCPGFFSDTEPRGHPGAAPRVRGTEQAGTDRSRRRAPHSSLVRDPPLASAIRHAERVALAMGRPGHSGPIPTRHRTQPSAAGATRVSLFVLLFWVDGRGVLRVGPSRAGLGGLAFDA
jgi:energy-coupling factor transport system permease protein